MRLISPRNLIEISNLGSLWSANDPLFLIGADPLTSLKLGKDTSRKIFLTQLPLKYETRKVT